MRGLVAVPGRKSIRRISDYVVGWRADQCLQQFVNQSTWDWEPVRRSLARHVAGMTRPKAWVVSEAVFPKNGSSSVGVAKQYAPSVGRILNCQIGLAMSLVGDGVSCPVDWRLMLPRCWDGDDARRARAHLPEGQRHRPRRRHLLDMIDEMVARWNLAPAPVVLDATDEPEVDQLLRGLDDRGLHYVVRVAAHTPALPARPRPDRGQPGRTLTVGELAAMAVRPGATMLNWQTRCVGHSAVTRFVAAPVPGESEPTRIVPGLPYRRPRHLLAQWSSGRARPSATWLTNLNVSRLPELIDLVKLHGEAAEDMARMHEDVGLRHFEGRSFRGWHHHVTLASIAHAYKLAQGLGETDEDLRLRPYA